MDRPGGTIGKGQALLNAGRAREKSPMDMRKCILTCLECHRICIETMAHGLARGGPYVDNRLIQTLSDCADICHTSASFMMRHSDMHVRTCGVCADVCDRCAHD